MLFDMDEVEIGNFFLNIIVFECMQAYYVVGWDIKKSIQFISFCGNGIIDWV